jgi:hypothetical protein
VCLLDVAEIFAVDEQARVAEPGISFEALPAGVVPLEAQPAYALGFPDPDEPDAVSRGERHIWMFGAVQLARTDVGIGSGAR